MHTNQGGSTNINHAIMRYASAGDISSGSREVPHNTKSALARTNTVKSERVSAIRARVASQQSSVQAIPDESIADAQDDWNDNALATNSCQWQKMSAR